MNRRGVIVLSADSGLKPFIDDVLEEVAPDEGESMELSRGRTCLALLSTHLRRRLLIIDGALPDIGVGALIEAIRLVDAELPVLLVRYGWAGPPRVHQGTHVHPGPLVSQSGVSTLTRLLAGTAR